MKYLFLSILIFNGVAVFAQPKPTLLTGKTTGKLPYIKYGLGDDRLGGAKMTYLDTNIAVKVVDSILEDYKVQLSRLHFAYLPKTNFLKDSISHQRAYYLSGSLKVFGDSVFDYVSINLDDRLPYRSIQQISPSRILVDIFGVTSNTNWITQLSTAKEIKNTWYEQIEDDVFRVFIELKHPQHWGHSIYYDSTGRKLMVRVKRQPPVLDIHKMKIAIDAGHGGDNNGASGITSKVLEKDYTLKIAKELEKLLKKNKVKTFMTRTSDTSLNMPERIEMLQAQNPDFLISIHLNSSDVDTVRGTSTYYRYIGFRPLTQAVMKRMLELKLKEFGNVGNFNFALSGPTDYPNCLVEVAFLSNVLDEKKILDPKFHKAVANKIYLGILDWLKQLK
ncbi:MAG: N-acetylmuramoyl-L-alanine amidase [Bacteroidetes bacterium]|nr:MAG: N-acetylmuramoyl-L-alanine amidase [Bacteroidota bacterium]